MNTPRFDCERSPGAPARLHPRKYSKWIPVPGIDDWFRHDSTAPGRRKIFAIVRPSAPTDIGPRLIRRVLIFDNHPDSLRLVFGSRVDSPVHPSNLQRMTSAGVALLWILVVGLMMAMFWPLL
jgi:hypothetical protein